MVQTMIKNEQKNIHVEMQTGTSQIQQLEEKNTVFDTKNFNLWYGDHHALKEINLDFKENEVTAIIGPSGCGKSTYIKALNRMVELVPIVKTSGEILYRGRNIFNADYAVEELRTKVGMVFQKPNPFRNRFTITLPMVQEFMVFETKKFLMKLSRSHCAVQRFGMK